MLIHLYVYAYIYTCIYFWKEANVFVYASEKRQILVQLHRILVGHIHFHMCINTYIQYIHIYIYMYMYTCIYVFVERGKYTGLYF